MGIDRPLCLLTRLASPTTEERRGYFASLQYEHLKMATDTILRTGNMVNDDYFVVKPDDSFSSNQAVVFLLIGAERHNSLVKAIDIP